MAEESSVGPMRNRRSRYRKYVQDALAPVPLEKEGQVRKKFVMHYGTVITHHISFSTINSMQNTINSTINSRIIILSIMRVTW